MTSLLAAILLNKDLTLKSDDIYLTYLPLSNLMDRVICLTMIANGGSIYFYNGDVDKIKEDLQEVKPTIFISIPRLYNKFYNDI
jgi:long-chain acyl-CoA synthetase